MEVNEKGSHQSDTPPLSQVGINQSYGSSLGTSERFPNESSSFPRVKAAFHVAEALLCRGGERQMFMAASAYTASFK